MRTPIDVWCRRRKDDGTRAARHSGTTDMLIARNRCVTRYRLLAATVAAAIAVFGLSPVMAGADVQQPLATESQDAVAAVNRVPGITNSTDTSVRRGRGSVALRAGAAAEVRVPDELSRGIALSGDSGEPVVLVPPGTENADKPAVVDSTVMLDDALEATDIAIQGTVDGGLRALLVISEEAAPQRFEFQLGVGGEQDGSLALRRDGGVDVHDSRGTVVADVAPPWAIDASGRSIPTRFEVDGTNLVQVVDHRGAVYPVVADPKITRSWARFNIQFNKSETRAIGLAPTTAVCSIILRMGVPGVIIGAVCAVAAISIRLQARRAMDRGMCLQIGVIPAVATYPDIYRGSNCR